MTTTLCWQQDSDLAQWMFVFAVNGKEEGVTVFSGAVDEGLCQAGAQAWCPLRQAWCWGWVFAAVQTQGVRTGEVMFNLPSSFSDFRIF